MHSVQRYVLNPFTPPPHLTGRIWCRDLPAYHFIITNHGHIFLFSRASCGRTDRRTSSATDTQPLYACLHALDKIHNAQSARAPKNPRGPYNTGVTGSSPTRGTDVMSQFLCVALTCAFRDLGKGEVPVQAVLPNFERSCL